MPGGRWVGDGWTAGEGRAGYAKRLTVLYPKSGIFKPEKAVFRGFFPRTTTGKVDMRTAAPSSLFLNVFDRRGQRGYTDIEVTLRCRSLTLCVRYVCRPRGVIPFGQGFVKVSSYAAPLGTKSQCRYGSDHLPVG